MRDVTREIAFGGEWTSARAEMVAALFDDMAPGWTDSHTVPTRMASIVDAIDRGRSSHPVRSSNSAPAPAWRPRLLAEPVSRSLPSTSRCRCSSTLPPGAGSRVRGDSSALPLPDDAVDALLLVNMLLFPGEVDRVLSSTGELVWVNTLAEETPIHLSPDDVVAGAAGQLVGTGGPGRDRPLVRRPSSLSSGQTQAHPGQTDSADDRDRAVGGRLARTGSREFEEFDRRASRTWSTSRSRPHRRGSPVSDDDPAQPTEGERLR